MVTFSGTRSISLWTSDGMLISDTNDDFAQLLAQDIPELFNANNDEIGADARSDDKVLKLLLRLTDMCMYQKIITYVCESVRMDEWLKCPPFHPSTPTPPPSPTPISDHGFPSLQPYPSRHTHTPMSDHGVSELSPAEAERGGGGVEMTSKFVLHTHPPDTCIMYDFLSLSSPNAFYYICWTVCCLRNSGSSFQIFIKIETGTRKLVVQISRLSNFFCRLYDIRR